MLILLKNFKNIWDFLKSYLRWTTCCLSVCNMTSWKKLTYSMNKVYFTCKLSGSRKILPRQLFFRVNIILQFSSVICFNSKARRVKTALKSVRSIIKSKKKIQNIRQKAYLPKISTVYITSWGSISILNSPGLGYIQSKVLFT